MPEIKCRTCGQLFGNWDEVSAHILEHAKIKNDPHKRDRAGILWAKKYKHRSAINKLKKIGQSKDAPYRQTLTKEQKLNKQDSRRVLSGKTKLVPIKCFNSKCKNGGQNGRREPIEIEYVESEQALRDGGCFLILCENCR